jgi:hypothetical protein
MIKTISLIVLTTCNFLFIQPSSADDASNKQYEQTKFGLISRGLAEDYKHLEKYSFRCGNWNTIESFTKFGRFLDGEFQLSSKSIKFTPQSWEKNPMQRTQMLPDLVITHQLLKKSRTDLQNLLGKGVPGWTVDPEDLSNQDTEWFSLNSSSSHSSSMLEISYKDNSVVGFRQVIQTWH